MSELASGNADYANIHGEIVDLLEAARRAAVRSVNAVMTTTYWKTAAAPSISNRVDRRGPPTVTR